MSDNSFRRLLHSEWSLLNHEIIYLYRYHFVKRHYRCKRQHSILQLTAFGLEAAGGGVLCLKPRIPSICTWNNKDQSDQTTCYNELVLHITPLQKPELAKVKKSGDHPLAE